MANIPTVQVPTLTCFSGNYVFLSYYHTAYELLDIDILQIDFFFVLLVQIYKKNL